MTELSAGPTDGGDNSAAGEWRRGWPVVLAGATAYGTGISLFNICAGLFIKPMHEALGWSIKALSIAPLIGIVMAFCNPFVGLVVDRWGARTALLWGMALYAIGVVILATAPATYAALYATALFIGLIAPFSSTAPVAKGTASWFNKSPGTAIGMSLTGVSVVALAAVPLISWSIQTFGWHSGYLTLAGLALIVGLPAALAAFREPSVAQSPHAGRSDGLSGNSLAEALRTFRFWMLGLALVSAALALGGYLTHLQFILASKDFTVGEATTLGMVFALSISIGRMGGGFLLDHLPDGLVATGLLLIAAFGSFLLGATGTDDPFAMIALAALLLGMAQGAEADFIAFFTLKFFGLRNYATIVSIYAMAVGLTMAAGGFLFATLFDAYQNYSAAILIGTTGFIVASIAMMITWLSIVGGSQARNAASDRLASR